MLLVFLIYRLLKFSVVKYIFYFMTSIFAVTLDIISPISSLCKYSSIFFITYFMVLFFILYALHFYVSNLFSHMRWHSDTALFFNSIA